MGEANDGFVSVVHAHGNSRTLEVIDVHNGGRLAISGGIYELELSGGGGNKVGGSVLVTKSVASNADRLDPSRNGFGDFGEDNGLTEDCASEDVTDLEGVGLVRYLWHGSKETKRMGSFGLGRRESEDG